MRKATSPRVVTLLVLGAALLLAPGRASALDCNNDADCGDSCQQCVSKVCQPRAEGAACGSGSTLGTCWGNVCQCQGLNQCWTGTTCVDNLVPNCGVNGAACQGCDAECRVGAQCTTKGVCDPGTAVADSTPPPSCRSGAGICIGGACYWTACSGDGTSCMETLGTCWGGICRCPNANQCWNGSSCVNTATGTCGIRGAACQNCNDECNTSDTCSTSGTCS